MTLKSTGGPDPPDSYGPEGGPDPRTPPASYGPGLGVKQGSVLRPILFAVLLDDLVDRRTNGRFSYVILYADDIILVSSSLCDLQIQLPACGREFKYLDIPINVDNS